MGPSPTIPTSFVPKQPVQATTRLTHSGGNLFLMIALVILGVSIAGSIGVFAYKQYLGGQVTSKSAELEAAELNVNSESVEQFIRSRDRFSAARALLDNHVAASHFFDLLESMTLQNVEFDALNFDKLADGNAKIQMSGTARSFNALAAQSSLFTAEKRIKRAIFSEIQVEENGAVTFALTADLDPRILMLTIENAPLENNMLLPGLPIASSTPTTTPAAAPAKKPSAAPVVEPAPVPLQLP